MIVGLEGKVIVVTGAASGIGAAIAAEASAAGAALLLTDRDGPGCHARAAEIGSGGGEATSVICDLVDVAAPGVIADAAVAAFGRIDGLVNAAGLTTRTRLGDATLEDWDALFAVNARAPFFLMQRAVADMLGRGAGGAIVNILSIHAHCGHPDLAVYSGAKGALSVLTKNAANAHLGDRVRVNAINLGWVATASEHRMQAETLGKGPGWLEAAAATRPLGRLVEAGEAARLAVFLLSDASAPLSGVAIELEQWVAGAPG